SGAMIQALQSQVDVGVAFRALVAGLNGVLAGMVEAFQRTVMALLASLGLGLWFNLVLKRRQGLMVQVAAAVERFVVPLVQPQASVEDMPETLAQLLTATREGFATIAKDNGLVREVALSSLSALHQMLAERKQAEDQHQSLLNSLNEDLHGTVTSLRGVVERHAELSSQLVAALMTLDSRRQPHILEDLPRVLTSLHTGFERQAEAVGSLNARLMDSQNRQSELMAEQVVALGEMAKAQQDNAQARAAADTAKGLQELRTLFSQLVTLLEARERDVPVQAYRQADVHTSSGEPEAVVAFQGQLLHMILQCLERPWWRRLMDDFGALRDPHHRPKYRRLGHATRRKHDAEATMPSSAGVAGANVTQAQGEAAS
ncbi:MAG: hypothetical protein VKP62_15825, partial [Candidatus Sericytochromatia bacterium]|nr:hypothetical protein [Candidatus Sericytochromatia bacterium]